MRSTTAAESRSPLPCHHCPSHRARPAGTVARGPLVGYRHVVGVPATAAAGAEQHRRSRRHNREPLPANYIGRHLVPGRGEISRRQLRSEFPPIGTCMRSSCVGSAPGSGSASSTPCATNCGCEPEGIAVRPRRSSMRRLSRSPTRYRMGRRESACKLRPTAYGLRERKAPAQYPSVEVPPPLRAS